MQQNSATFWSTREKPRCLKLQANYSAVDNVNKQSCESMRVARISRWGMRLCPPSSPLDWVLSHWAHFTVLRLIFVYVLCVSLYIACIACVGL